MRIRRSRLSRAVPALITCAGLAAAVLSTSSAEAGEILSVKNESANFREGPGEKHPVVFAADRFYPVEVQQKKDGWAQVKDFEGDVAWVAERLLAKTETVVVEGDRVNVRDKSSTSAEIVFKAERGEVFKVEERHGKWLRVVDASGDGGWIREDMVWGERAVAAASPRGKTKGELDVAPKGAEPSRDDRKGAAAPADGAKAAPPKTEPNAPAEGAPKEAEPKPAAEPKAAEPKAAEPKAAEPKKAEPKPAAEPKEAEPKEAEPEEAEPEEADAEPAAAEPAPKDEADDADAAGDADDADDADDAG